MNSWKSIQVISAVRSGIFMSPADTNSGFRGLTLDLLDRSGNNGGWSGKCNQCKGSGNRGSGNRGRLCGPCNGTGYKGSFPSEWAGPNRVKIYRGISLDPWDGGKVRHVKQMLANPTAYLQNRMSPRIEHHNGGWGTLAEALSYTGAYGADLEGKNDALIGVLLEAEIHPDQISADYNKDHKGMRHIDIDKPLGPCPNCEAGWNPRTDDECRKCRGEGSLSEVNPPKITRVRMFWKMNENPCIDCDGSGRQSEDYDAPRCKTCKGWGGTSRSPISGEVILPATFTKWMNDNAISGPALPASVRRFMDNYLGNR